MAWVSRKVVKGHPYWVVGWRDGEGKQRSRSCGDEGEANNLRLAIEGGGVLARPVVAEGVSVGEAVARWVLDRASGSRETARSYLSIGRAFCGHVGPQVPVAAVRQADVQAWKQARVAEGKKGSTVRANLKAMKAFFGWAMRQGLVVADPTVGIDVPRSRRALPRWIDEARTGELIGALAGDVEADPDWLAVVLLAVRMGLRRGEILGLRWEDVHLAEGLLEVRRTKSRDQRRLPIHREVAGVLGGRERAGPWVFGSRYGDPTRQGSSVALSKGLNRWLSRGGWGVGLHGLRHSFATQLALRGASALQLREWLGHSSLSTTLLYVQAAGGDAGLLGRLGS